MTDKIEQHPVQVHHILPRDRPKVPAVVSLRAYEVYCRLWGPQEQLITGECRGGFGVNELIALLYAHSFPETEWRQRFKEACNGMEHI